MTILNILLCSFALAIVGWGTIVVLWKIEKKYAEAKWLDPVTIATIVITMGSTIVVMLFFLIFIVRMLIQMPLF